MRHLCSFNAALFALAAVTTTLTVGAQEMKDTAPRITAVSPLAVKPGEAVQLRLRGVKLDEAQSIRFSTAGADGITVELKEKKKAGNIPGFEEPDSGGTEAEFRFTVPSGLQLCSLRFTVVTAGGDT